MTSWSIDRAVATVLRADLTGVTEDWMTTLVEDPTCRPGALLSELEVRSTPLLEELAEALEAGPPVASAEHCRTAVKEWAFVGGWLAGQGASPSLAARYASALSDVLQRRTGATAEQWLDWRPLELALSSAIVETYCLSLRADAEHQLQDLLERAAPFIHLPGDLPALLVVGRPNREVFSRLCGRLMIEVARVGAPALIVDCTWCVDFRPELREVVASLAGHRKLQDRTVIVAGLPAADRDALAEMAIPALQLCDDWRAAVALAQKKPAI
jgi:hypothetical protein